MVLTDAPTNRRLVNAMAGRIRTTGHDGFLVAPWFEEYARGGAWGVPGEAVAYAALIGARTSQTMAVRIVDVDTREEWIVTIPARFTVDRHPDHTPEKWEASIITDTLTGWVSGPLSQTVAEERAVAANVDALTGDWE